MRTILLRHLLQYTWLRLASLWALCGLSLFAASCGTAAFSPGPVHPLTSATCGALRAAVATTVPVPTDSVAHSHRTYTLTTLGPLPLQRIWHPGATMRFMWCAAPGPLTDSTQPSAVVLTAQVAGPFPSFATAAAAERTSMGPGNGGAPPFFPPRAVGQIVVATRPLHTNTWTGTDQTATLALPTTLAPGFYLCMTATQVLPAPGAGSMQVGDSSSTGGIVQVIPT